ncbi:16S rRNA (cytosine(1402)-N(4))-methyltransferase RsmH [Acidiluteibacter ferrifornacis]|uniref:Ribosomal RNA small subunit methyltransferase H n=1 Tax=Acidiluteibacter ferrifornacis TaxID=2692424 RepID=A0A6N9NI71_9FLAO|nr:16S rRNA (cytosine(1402)-N(4))-methyltransferase RsmH [Acidiluteibacter ferrifornacis]NBG65221.1 16S rRNA (cytosine(1402)-N(4))-methyltransferase RsmH [Acidiluteibacter ferrifornacis]
MMGEYHKPVMLHESIDGLDIKPDGVYIDVTFGGGGHSKAILERLGEGGRLFAFDRDPDAANNKIEDDRFELIAQDFKFLKNYLRFYRVSELDGILADLGVSSHQFNEGSRGFSIRFDGPLDMRMDQKSPLTAATIVNEYEESVIADILFQYGELRNSRKIAQVIVAARSEKPIKTIEQLKSVLQPLTPWGKENRFLAQVFQALRIEVNGELDSLKALLEQSLEMLKPGGRLSVITYHSLEDRLVKNFMQKGKFEGEVEKDFFGNKLTPFELVNRKPIMPSMEELGENNRSRSAKLRVAKKIENESV